MVVTRQDRRDPAPVPGARVLVVEARFYDDLTDELLRGATEVLAAAGARVDVVTVPGALGCVIRGETFHFEIVAGESARALMDLSVARQLPLGNGILTVENEAQAWTRARVSELNKGGGAAEAALAVLRIKRRLMEEAQHGETR